jgi:hypothetical protein
VLRGSDAGAAPARLELFEQLFATHVDAIVEASEPHHLAAFLVRP